MDNKRTKAFTLAEIMVTLGVIGIVAAITIPGLVRNYQKNVYVTSAHKFYNELTQAFVRLLNDKNVNNLKYTDFVTTANGEAAGKKNFYTSNFNIITNCGTAITPCFATQYTNIKGDKTVNITDLCKGEAFTVGSGTSMCVQLTDKLASAPNGFYGGYTDASGVTHGYSYVYFDVNGADSPNVIGRDLFEGYIFEDGSVDEAAATPECKVNPSSANCGGKASLTAARLTASDCTDGSTPAGCLGQLLNNDWKMDY